MNALAGKIALVTGVGQRIAFALAYEGAKVAVTGRTLAKCEASRDEITRSGFPRRHGLGELATKAIALIYSSLLPRVTQTIRPQRTVPNCM